jgi:tripartite-type tricarboxylate transporter receptor subunit TctC
MRYIQTFITASAFTATLVCGATAAHAQCTAPTIKMVVPNPAGGTGDLIARVLGEKAGADLGQPIVVDNISGASTTIGTNTVAKAKPDGCTILSLTSSGVVVSVLRDNMPYNLSSDFVPILGVGSFPMVLTVPANSKIRSFADLVASAKSKDGIVYASGGIGTLAHLSSVRLVGDVGGTATHVPYRGNADAIQGLLGNHVQIFFPSTAEALPLMKSGKVRLLGITSDERLASLPDVPTMKELGFADFNPRVWYAFLAPANTSESTVARYRTALTKAVQDPAVQDRLKALGFAPEVKDSAELAAYMKSEAARWGKVIKDNKITSAD